jgi:phosphatidate cytidylyltransferase
VLHIRLLTAAAALPLLMYLVCCAPLWLFSAAVLGLTVVGLCEYFALARSHNPLSSTIGLTWGITVAVAMLSLDVTLTTAALIAGLFVTYVLSLRDLQPERGVHGVSYTLFGVVYISFLLPHLLWLRRSPDGVAWVFFVLLVAMSGDTAGYAVGRLWGRHKLIPHISPGKTIEGSIGAVVGNIGAALLSWVWLLPHRSYAELVGLALIVGFLAQAGDLCESAFKRACGSKDSGHFFPGHGGVLDRVDSLLFSAAFIYYYVTLEGR